MIKKELSTASVSRRFLRTLDLTGYRELKMYMYIPQGVSFPEDLFFTLSIRSSENQRMDIDIPSTMFKNGWNEIEVRLFSPYEVLVNETSVGNMSRVGTLLITKRVSEIEFGLKAESRTVLSGTEIWLDEWHLTGTEKYVDQAYFVQGKLGYSGPVVSIGYFPIIRDTSIRAGYEEKKGIFINDLDFKSTSYFGGGEVGVLPYLDAGILISKENTSPFRDLENIPGDPDLETSSTGISHEIKIDPKFKYLPILKHNFEYSQKQMGLIELTDIDYKYSSVLEYESAFNLNALFDFPFGLGYSYSFTRDWIFRARSTIYPETSFDYSTSREALLNQIHEMLFSYSSEKLTWSINLSRDLLFGGASVPGSTEWLSSYSHSISTIFSNAGDTLEQAYLSGKNDKIELILDMPLQKKVGFNFYSNTLYTETNFRQDTRERDVIVKNNFTLSVPFRVFGENGIELQPGMERGFEGDYKQMLTSTLQEEILVEMYGHLFMPPFYYISPFESLGREKDYDAVDIFKNNSTKNTFTTGYFLNFLFPVDGWYIPSIMGISLGGETKREGETYTQKRNLGVTAGKNIPLGRKKNVYDYSLDVQFAYEHERNYSTKVLSNSFELETGFDFLKTPYKGFLIDHTFTYERERQKIDEPSLYLFPSHPEREIEVPYKPYRDTLKNSLIFNYLWELDIKKWGLFSALFSNVSQKVFIQNSEIFKFENIYTFTDKERAESFSNIPFRLTLEHKSSYNLTDKVQFGMNLMWVVGIEQKIIPPSTSGNILPSMGFEAGISIKIIF